MNKKQKTARLIPLERFGFIVVELKFSKRTGLAGNLLNNL
jgi:hypothetical protein